MAILSDVNLVTFLINIGYEQKEVKSEKKYFVNKNGSQVRIGRDGIALIDKGGYLLSKRKSVESNILEAFSNRPYVNKN